MPFSEAFSLGGALLGLLGGNRKEAAKRKQEEEKRRLEREAAMKLHGVREGARIGSLRGLQASAAARGIKGSAEAFDPSMFEERPFTGAELPQETGTSFLGDALAGAGGLARATGDILSQEEGEEQNQAELDRIMCAISPQLCPGGVPPSSRPGFDPAAPADEEYV